MQSRDRAGKRLLRTSRHTGRGHGWAVATAGAPNGKGPPMICVGQADSSCRGTARARAAAAAAAREYDALEGLEPRIVLQHAVHAANEAVRKAVAQGEERFPVAVAAAAVTENAVHTIRAGRIVIRITGRKGSWAPEVEGDGSSKGLEGQTTLSGAEITESTRPTTLEAGETLILTSGLRNEEDGGAAALENAQAMSDNRAIVLVRALLDELSSETADGYEGAGVAAAWLAN